MRRVQNSRVSVPAPAFEIMKACPASAGAHGRPCDSKTFLRRDPLAGPGAAFQECDVAAQPGHIEIDQAAGRRRLRELRPRKKLVGCSDRDYSQRLRLGLQTAFLLLNVFVGTQFYLFVRYFESAGRTARVPRPAGVDGWLPIGGLMSLKYSLATWTLPHMHPSAMFLLLAFLLMSVLFRKAFCGWLCPVGTLSEGLWKLGRRLFKMNWRLPVWADLPLRGLKYLLLGLFLYAVGSMPVAAIRGFLESPYFLVADVKMMNFFRHIGTSAAITVALLVLLSVMTKNFWCRYLCPYGALVGIASWLSPTRIRRDPEACIDCAKCRRACPALLPVDTLVSIKSAECTACMECVASCPAQGALQLSLPGRRALPTWALAAGVAAIFLGVVFLAKLAGAWETAIPDEVYFQLVPRVMEFVHP
jgi:polyferredoxin